MHKVVRFIIVADNADEALDLAKDQLNKMVEENRGGLDYGTFFDEDGGVGQGKGRYGPLLPAVKFGTKEAAEFILNAFIFEYQRFMGHIAEIEQRLASGEDKEKLFLDPMFRYILTDSGRSEWLVYSGFFHSINDIQDVLLHADHDKLWVVPCDVHF